MRPCDVVRILNSTQFGEVINDGQLYRHRQRAPWVESRPRRINFISFAAYLVSRRHKKKTRKRFVRGKEVVSLSELWKILEDQNERCALTGLPLAPDNFAVDHKTPVKHGGNFRAENTQLVLPEVNRAKHTMGQEQFINMCLAVARHCCPTNFQSFETKNAAIKSDGF